MADAMISYQVVAFVLILVLVSTPPMMHSLQKSDEVIATGLALIHRNTTILHADALLVKVNAEAAKNFNGNDFIGITKYVASYTQSLAKTDGNDGKCIEDSPHQEKAGAIGHWAAGGSLMFLAIVWLCLGCRRFYTCVSTTGALGCIFFSVLGLFFCGLTVIYAYGWREMNELECEEMVPWIESTVTSIAQVEAETKYPDYYEAFPTGVNPPGQIKIASSLGVTEVLPVVFQQVPGIFDIDSCSYFATATGSLSATKSATIAQSFATTYNDDTFATAGNGAIKPVTTTFYEFVFSKSPTELEMFCEDMNAKLSYFFGYVTITLSGLTFISFLISCFCCCSCCKARASRTPSRDVTRALGETVDEREGLMRDEKDNFTTKPFPHEIGANRPPPKDDSCWLACSRWTSCARQGRR
jgi:hypothetical protein